MENKFNEDDKKLFIEFLNLVAKEAVFTHKIEGAIKLVQLLGHMQKVVLPKIDANILEVLRVHNPPSLPSDSE